MVAAFVSAIFCSLDGLQRHRDMNRLLHRGQYLKVGAVSLKSSDYQWGELETIYREPLTYRRFKKEGSTLYLVSSLGTGETSKAYRAVTINGYECVVKMYVKCRDDGKEIFDEKTFDRIAAQAVAKEVKAYNEFYPELNWYVWKEVLNGFSCVIHPYFKQPKAEEQNDLLLEPIRGRLQLFGKKKMKFPLYHHPWHPVGFFEGKLYLFELGHLAPFEKDDTIDEVTSNYITYLKGDK